METWTDLWDQSITWIVCFSVMSSETHFRDSREKWGKLLKTDPYNTTACRHVWKEDLLIVSED